MTTHAPNFRALCAELLQPLAEYDDADPYHEHCTLIARTRTALATPPPEPPADSDKEESEQLRSLFDLTRHQMADALGVDRGYGWTSLAMEAKQLRKDRALTTPPPEPPMELPVLPPGYIDFEHTGQDREILDAFYRACNSEGGTADEIHLRGIRAVLEKWG
jgi:hypothetical protein